MFGIFVALMNWVYPDEMWGDRVNKNRGYVYRLRKEVIKKGDVKGKSEIGM